MILCSGRLFLLALRELCNYAGRAVSDRRSEEKMVRGFVGVNRVRFRGAALH